MMGKHYDFVIIGGGIVGLATSAALLRSRPGAQLLLLDKEKSLAAHQTGRNSGVIHSGIYYKPGSLKAKMAREGNAAMVEFCRAHGIAYEVCGKVIVATRESELPLLDNLYQRGLENELAVEKLTAEQTGEIEPHVRCLAALRVPSTGIADYKAVCLRLAEQIQDWGGEIVTGARVERILWHGSKYVLQTKAREFEAKFLINCAGLHSDRIARLGGARPDAQIVPFRGEYFELKRDRRHLVKHLIYPVPNPDFPFLGAHFTRMIDGNIHCGPNAVLAFGREGYRKTQVNPRDLSETMRFPGFWKLAIKYPQIGTQEMWRSLNKAAFVRSLQEMIPEVRSEDLVPSPSGIRAQALRADGSLVDDFLITPGENALHVLNAPSPAATAALEIGKAIAAQVL
jgi:L-2-hydroxyglutarate oxidase